MNAPHATLAAPIPYTVETGEKLVNETFGPNNIRRRNQGNWEARTMPVENGRLHAADLSPMRERLPEFLSGWLGGPPLYFQRPDHNCIVSAHRPFAIGPDERDQWLMCMAWELPGFCINHPLGRSEGWHCLTRSSVNRYADRPG